jgi:acetyl esterase
MTVGMRQPSQVIPVGTTEDLTIPGPAGPMRARVYRPEAEGEQAPTLVFIHGGGFVIGDIDTHDNQARALCRGADAVVLSVDYRLAPEDPWPAGVEDGLAAVRWAAENIDRLGGDPSRLAVGGDSAGGNLSAVVAQQLRDSDGPQLAAQLLIYPAVDLDPDGDYPSRVENADGYLLTAADMEWFGAHYLDDDQRRDPRASVLHADDLAGVAPAVIGVAEYDPLRDEGEAYAKKLSDAGVEVVLHRFDGLIHGFYGLGLVSPAAAAAVTTLNNDLATLLR